MRKLILFVFLSSNVFANYCENLEEIANSYKSDLKTELQKTVFPKDENGQQEFKARFNERFNYLKALKYELDTCYEDYGIEKSYNCRFSSDLIKERPLQNLITTYTSAVRVNRDCLANLYLGHTITRNMQGKIVYKKLEDMYDINTVYKCDGGYPGEDYSFRKFLISDDNFFVMDQYLVYPTQVKVLAKKYKTENRLEVEHRDTEVIFRFGQALIAISTTDGTVIRSNFLSLRETKEGQCQTYFDRKNNSIYPRTNIDEKRWEFDLEYVSY